MLLEIKVMLLDAEVMLLAAEVMLLHAEVMLLHAEVMPLSRDKGLRTRYKKHRRLMNSLRCICVCEVASLTL